MHVSFTVSVLYILILSGQKIIGPHRRDAGYSDCTRIGPSCRPHSRRRRGRGRHPRASSPHAGGTLIAWLAGHRVNVFHIGARTEFSTIFFALTVIASTRSCRYRLACRKLFRFRWRSPVSRLMPIIGRPAARTASISAGSTSSNAARELSTRSVTTSLTIARTVSWIISRREIYHRPDPALSTSSA